MLGLAFASEGSKAIGFSPIFQTLGVQLDLSGWARGFFHIGHTDKRRSDLLEAMEAMLTKPDVLTKDLESLHGKLVWFRTFVFGRKLNQAVRIISKFSRLQKRSIPLCGELREALVVLTRHLELASPLRICRPDREVWHVFTDGAYEPDAEHPATLGEVLVNHAGDPVEFFGLSLPGPLLDECLADSKHPIYELEVLPIVVALEIWSPVLFNKHVVFHIDNTAACSAMIRADGATQIAKTLVDRFVVLEERLRIWPWFSRVPSHSNPADAASRLDD